MKHLFVALIGTAMGEALQGVRLAGELAAGGDEVLFLAPRALSVLLRDAPVRAGYLDRAIDGHRILESLAEAVAEEGCDSIVLVDTASVLSGLLVSGESTQRLFELGAPVIGLDLWNLTEAGAAWDMSPGRWWEIPRAHWQRVRRLVPVPVARPSAAFAYDALPAQEPLDADAREAVRHELGLAPGRPLVLWPTAAWQMAAGQSAAPGKALAAALPPLVLEALAGLAGDLQLVQVGATPLQAEGGPLHFRALPNLPPAQFARLVAAADLLIGFNQSATSLALACAAEVPCVVGINSRHAPPFTEFRVWPLGLHDFLTPVLIDNPVASTHHTVELLEPGAFAAACHSLLFDPAAASALRAAQRAYKVEVRRLPGPRDAFLGALARPPGAAG